MILIDLNDVQNYPKNRIPCKCNNCNRIFDVEKKKVKYGIKIGWNIGMYCNSECSNMSKNRSVDVICLNCNKNFIKIKSQIKKTNRNFCCHSCAATYNNKHKTKGIRRSKLEIWLERKLTNIYPNLEIHFSRKDTINSELDIYIPSIRLGIEINGIHHSKPIYGNNKLEQVKANDIKKYDSCKANDIELLLIDTSNQLRFTEKTSIAFLDVITNVIEDKMVGAVGYAPT